MVRSVETFVVVTVVGALIPLGAFYCSEYTRIR